MIWTDDGRIKIDPPKRPKRITGTRLATILGLNHWSTPFSAWCEITKTYQEPFVDTIYTLAGKAIEPIQMEYMRSAYGMTNLRTPTDVYGENYFQKTWGNFFPDETVFGGMWDALLVDESGATTTVLEFKTTKRAEDWSDDVPEYYALQAALYAYLLGVDEVIMVASFLGEKDYSVPGKFKPCAANTITIEFKVSERYPDFDMTIDMAVQWWQDHVETGVSPAYDEKRDANILAILRTNTLAPDTDIAALIAEGETLRQEIETVSVKIADKEKRLKIVTETIKQHALKQFRDGDSKVSFPGQRYNWSVCRSEAAKLDEAALKADGLYDKYLTTKPSYRMSVTEIKEGA